MGIVGIPLITGALDNVEATDGTSDGTQLGSTLGFREGLMVGNRLGIFEGLRLWWDSKWDCLRAPWKEDW